MYHLDWPLSDSTEVSSLAEEFMIQILESQVQSPRIKAAGDDNANIVHHIDVLSPMNCGDFTLYPIQDQMVNSTPLGSEVAVAYSISDRANILDLTQVGSHRFASGLIVLRIGCLLLIKRGQLCLQISLHLSLLFGIAHSDIMFYLTDFARQRDCHQNNPFSFA